MSYNLNEFSLPPHFRGKNGFIVQLWWLVQSTFFACSPQFMYGWRRFLLRCFGCKVGRNCIIRPTVRITYPWKVVIGDNSWIGDNTELYSLGEISIGKNSVISQKSYICTGSHNYLKDSFDIFSTPVSIGDGVWIATDVYVAPGVTIGNNAVVGARSSVFKDLPENSICFGSPAHVVKYR